MTKRDLLNMVVTSINSGVDFTADQKSAVVDYALKEIAAIDDKNTKASTRRAEKSSATRNELTAAVTAQLSHNPTKLADIASAIGVSAPKIQGIMSAMVKTGTVVKTEVRDGKSKKVAYYLA